ncbi:MAG: pyridoxamine 5'-phosphate oxidase family protein [Acidimicrobiales bacterium]
MDLAEVIQESKRFGAWAHMATVSPSATPYVSPVHPCWDGETLWTLVSVTSVKASNLAANPLATVHWQVSQETDLDSLIVWGRATVHSDLEAKRQLWEGVFDYDLNEFAPGGPEESPEAAFVGLEPTKAVLLRHFGMAGRDEWRAEQ